MLLSKSLISELTDALIADFAASISSRVKRYIGVIVVTNPSEILQFSTYLDT